MKAKLWLCVASLLAAALFATALGVNSRSVSAHDSSQADGKGDRPRNAAAPAPVGPTSPGNGINDHGGPVTLGAVRMYYIWYGTWDAASKSILTNFANSIGGSPYFNINTSYFDASNSHISNSVSYGGSAADDYSLGKSLTDSNVAAIVSSVLAKGSLPTDSNGIYFVLTSPDVTETSGFTTGYCAWHTSATLNGSNIKYAFVGDGSKLNPQACSAQTTVSPNGNPAMDAMASLIAGELDETVTDPNLSAWYDSTGQENADKCAWNFGSTYTLPNGSVANMNLGGHDFLIQQNWVNAAGGSCALSSSVTTDSGSGAGANGTTTHSSLAVINTAGVSGSLTGSGDSNTTAASLTTEGTSDWIHFGDASLSRKTGGGAQLSNYTTVGTGPAPVQLYSNDPRPLSWTDGTPTASSTSNFKGLYTSGTGKGFSLIAPADATLRTVIVHVGGWNSSGTLTAHLSDSSSADFTSTTASVSGQYDRNYKLIYQATGLGQTLIVTWKLASGTGNVTLNGAALSGPPPLIPSITATGGTPQTATISTAFANPLQATVKDASNNPISGAPVTFTAPATGASGTFSGSATVNTDVTGVATAPMLTANSTAGHYTVVASTPGALATASFSLTNQAGLPASITATGGTPQGATISAGFLNRLAATVKDVGGNAVSGATVLFTAPASDGASGAFTGPTSTASVLTIADGTATAPAFTANGLTGSYSVTASVAGVSPSASFNLTNNPIPVGGGLSGTGDSMTTAISLTTEGTSDWVHFGDASLSRKALGGSQLNSTVVGGGATNYTNDTRLLSWTDGTPTASSSNNAKGILVSGASKGFSITAPADTTTRTLIVHVGGSNSGGTFTAHLSDASATDFTDVTPTVSGLYDRDYTLVYYAGGAGKSLTLTWKMSTGSGDVSVSGAALVGPAAIVPGITPNGGTPQSATIGLTFANPLTVLVKDLNSGNLISGAPVTFAAPGSGASGTFGGTATINTDVNGAATAPAFTANGIAGQYSVVASTPGALTAASFSLTNLVGSAASVTATGGTPQAAIINTAFGNPLVAMVKDLGGNPVSGATVTFAAPGSGASGTFTGGLTSVSVLTIGNGTATAPPFTANALTGGYNVTAGVPGASGANFALTNSPVNPITLVQHATVNTGIVLPYATVTFSAANKTGNFIAVGIYGGQSTTQDFKITDTNGNIYQRVLTQANDVGDATLGIYYAENIKPGPNTVTIVPTRAAYLRVSVMEYSGIATSNSLDVFSSAKNVGSANSGNFIPDSGTVTTTADGDLLLGVEICGDANSVAAGPGYTIVDLVPNPGTKLISEQQIQTSAGPTSATTISQNNWGWAMGLAAFKKAH